VLFLYSEDVYDSHMVMYTSPYIVALNTIGTWLGELSIVVVLVTGPRLKKHQLVTQSLLPDTSHPVVLAL
jgi:hypothetical protein